MRPPLQAGAPVPRPPAPQVPAARRVPTGARRSDIARRARAAASAAEQAHPALGTPGHLRDAARSLEHGNTEAAKRHLRAAMNLYQPVSLYRHGVLDDEGHTAGRQHLDAIHRLHLQVQDVEDIEQGNQQRLAARHAALPQHGPSFNQASLPGVAQGREPSGRAAAMNAPAKVPSGGPGNAAQGPKAPIPKASEQIYANGGWLPPAMTTVRNDTGQPIELVGPHGYIHNWVFVGVPGSKGSYQSLLAHPHLSRMDAMDQAVISSHLKRAASAAASGDHTTAEIHLRDAQRRADARGEHSLASSIDVNRQFHHDQATSFLRRPGSGQPPSYEKWAAASAARQRAEMPKVNPRAVTSGVPFALSRPFELSAQTGALASTPRPYGRPGGPGLYGVKGLKHSDYLENIVHALMTKRGMDKGKATAIARGAIRKWMRGGGNVHPEVRAAATAAEAEENAAQARAHAHAGRPGQVIDLYNPQQARVPAGQAGGGRFGSGQGGQSKAAGGGSKAARRSQLLHQAADDRRRAAALEVTLRQLEASQRKMAAGTKAATKAGSTGKTKSSTPAKKTGTSAASAKSAASAAGSSASVSSRISALRRQITQLRAQAAALTRQATALSGDSLAVELAWTGWMKEMRGKGGQWVTGGGGIPGVSSPGTWVPSSGSTASRVKPPKFAVGHKVVTEGGDHGVIESVHPNGLLHVRMADGTAEDHTENELHHHDPSGKLIGALTTFDKIGAATLPGKHSAGPRRRLQAYQRQPTQLIRSGMPGM